MIVGMGARDVIVGALGPMFCAAVRGTIGCWADQNDHMFGGAGNDVLSGADTVMSYMAASGLTS